MITSRIAQKHRDYAAELGVDHYLGKPYSEEDLLALVARYAAHAAAALHGRPERASLRCRELVDHLAELTGFRDRDVLDVTLVGALHDLLRPRVGRDLPPSSATGATSAGSRARASAPATSSPPPTRRGPSSTACRGSTTSPRARDCLRRQQVITRRRRRRTLRCSRSAPTARSVGVLELETDAAARRRRPAHGLQHPAHLPQLPGPARLQRARHADRPAEPQDLRRELPEAVARCRTPTRRSPAIARRAARGRASRYWLGVIDIDHFKRVNDTYGHLIGDEVLLLLSRLMRSSFRFHDRLYRFGGEEFVVLMRCGSDADAALRVRAPARRTPSTTRSRRSATSPSASASPRCKPTDTPSAAFERADKAVYYAKAHGRNQVQSHAALVAQRRARGRRQGRRRRAVLAGRGWERLPFLDAAQRSRTPRDDSGHEPHHRCR